MRRRLQSCSGRRVGDQILDDGQVLKRPDVEAAALPRSIHACGRSSAAGRSPSWHRSRTRRPGRQNGMTASGRDGAEQRSRHRGPSGFRAAGHCKSRIGLVPRRARAIRSGRIACRTQVFSFDTMAPPQPHPSHQSSKRKLSSKADLWRPWFRHSTSAAKMPQAPSMQTFCP